MQRKIERKSREVRKDQIYRHIRQYPGSTSYAIAHGIGLAPSGHLRDIIWELADEGRIRAETQVHRINMVKFTYTATAVAHGH